MQTKGIRSHAELQARQLELQSLLRRNQPDRASIDRLVREISDLRAQQMKAMIDSRFAFQELLTADQRKKLRDLRSRGKGPRPEPGATRRARPGRPAQPRQQPQPRR